jgi:hypothetical protein
MHIDGDGDTILDTRQELEQFARTTSCGQCRAEAREMLDVVDGVGLVKLVFCTTCEHGR